MLPIRITQVGENPIQQPSFEGIEEVDQIDLGRHGIERRVGALHFNAERAPAFHATDVSTRNSDQAVRQLDAQHALKGKRCGDYQSTALACPVIQKHGLFRVHRNPPDSAKQRRVVHRNITDSVGVAYPERILRGDVSGVDIESPLVIEIDHPVPRFPCEARDSLATYIRDGAQNFGQGTSDCPSLCLLSPWIATSPRSRRAFFHA